MAFITDEEFNNLGKTTKTNSQQPGVIDRIKTDLSNRVGEAKDIIIKTGEGKITPVETGIRTFGTAIGAAGDVAGEALMSIPFVKNIAQSVGNTDQVKAVVSAYSDWASQHPRAAKNLEAIGNIASVVPAYKGAQVGANTALKATQDVALVASKAGNVAGKGLEKAGELAYKSAIPLSKQEAKTLQAFKAGVGSKPLLAADTALSKGFMGTEKRIGVQAAKEADNLWSNTVKPALQNIKSTINTNEVMSALERKIKKSIVEPIRQKDMLQQLSLLKEAYKGVPTMTHEFAQDIKSSLYKHIPEKVFKGKTVSSVSTELKAMFAKELRGATRKALEANKKALQAFDDYGNLKALMEFGQSAMTGAKKKGGFGSFMSSLYENLSVPAKTIGGTTLKKAGKALQGK